MVDPHSNTEIDAKAAARMNLLIEHDAEAALFVNFAVRIRYFGQDQVVAELEASALEAKLRQKAAFVEARASVEALVARQPLRTLHVPPSLYLD
jgi:hypothetical protein